MRWIAPSALIVFLASVPAARAGAIVSYNGSLLGIQLASTPSVTLPDDFQGGTFDLGSLRLSALAVPDGHGGWTYGSQAISYDQPFGFEIDLRRPEDAPGLNAASAYLSGNLSGEVIGPAGSSHLGGGFVGTFTTAQTETWFPASAFLPDEVRAQLDSQHAPGPPLPDGLLDLFRHPERLHLTGVVAGGAMNLLDITLTIDPPGPGDPSPVPEPAALVTFAAGLAAYLVRRRYAARR